MSAKEIQRAIESYALAYEELQSWQEKSDMIPIGDQKTGCIGEFYAYLYLMEKYPDSELTFAGHSQKGWDIEVKSKGFSGRIQVKTVSAYSTTRTISPIHYGWNQLFIIYLGKDFKPRGFWIIRDVSTVKKGEVLKSRKCKAPGKSNSGSKDIPLGQNQVNEITKSIISAIGT
jgi:hypothetical protein